MAFTRTTIVRGPAILQFGLPDDILAGTRTFYCSDDINVNITLQDQPWYNSAFGRVGSRIWEVSAEVTATPLGLWRNDAAIALARRALFWPHIGKKRGDRIYPSTQATEKNLVIWTLDGTKYTFKNAEILNMPPMVLSGTRPMVGPVTWTCLRATATTTNVLQKWSEQNSLYATSSVAFDDTSFAETDELWTQFTGDWGTVTGFQDFESETGFTVTPTVSVTPLECDDYGIYDYMVDDLDVTVSFRPVGTTIAQLKAAVDVQYQGGAFGGVGSGVDVTRGYVIGGYANDNKDFTITGAVSGAPLVTLTNCEAYTDANIFSLTENRVPEITLRATRDYTSSVSALMTLSKVT